MDSNLTRRRERQNARAPQVHKCPVCGKEFSRLEHVRRHMVNHGQRRWPCPYHACQSFFHRNDILENHIRRLHGQKNYFSSPHWDVVPTFNAGMVAYVQLSKPASLLYEPALSALDGALNYYYGPGSTPTLSPLREKYALGLTENTIAQAYASASANTALSYTVNASALRALSQSVPESSELPTLQRSEYIKSVRALRDAINDPVLNQSNNTLMATFIMARVEISGMTEEFRFKNFMNHLEATAQLIRHRRLDANRDPRDRLAWKLFQGIRHVLLAWGISRGKDMPTGIDWTADSILDDNPLRDFTHISLAIPNLLVMTSKCKDLSSAELAATIVEATSLDAALSSWHQNLNLEWRCQEFQHHRPEISTSSQDPYVWQGKYHIYTDPWVAAQINNHRVYRIEINRAILACLDCSENTENELWLSEKQRALGVIQDMVNDICSSVPGFLGRDAAQAEQLESNPAGDRWTVEWPARPLALCSKLDTVSTEQREWIQGRIKEIARRSGNFMNILSKNMTRGKTSGPTAR